MYSLELARYSLAALLGAVLLGGVRPYQTGRKSQETIDASGLMLGPCSRPVDIEIHIVLPRLSGKEPARRVLATTN